uniref:Uncharacterized protein n=1 Tax=Candidatus Kentrum eta TaxID=2126337 RepID=A0A450UIW2_9GAMM|nr:MAG: hypothetical protein BECKH772B_GA0070898_100308 [Candidatus Kentron sp. H]
MEIEARRDDRGYALIANFVDVLPVVGKWLFRRHLQTMANKHTRADAKKSNTDFRRFVSHVPIVFLNLGKPCPPVLPRGRDQAKTNDGVSSQIRPLKPRPLAFLARRLPSAPHPPHCLKKKATWSR